MVEHEGQPSSFLNHGAARYRGAALADLGAILDALSDLPQHRAGLRLADRDALRPHLVMDGAIGAIAASLLPRLVIPVRAILFDKSPQSNWSLGWHQDRTICVRSRIATAGFGPWTVKAGVHHVAPPFALLERMVTLRVHLDPVAASNAPLLISPGSHRLGLVLERDIPQAIERCGVAVCLADIGDVWAYSTPILHASKAAASPGRRRVLQIDYACEELTGGLVWRGV